MKVLAISGSPRKGGNTEILLNEALKGAVEAGAETELISVSGKDLKPCDGCETCYKTGKCHIKDDMQGIYDKMLAADGIIIGCPSYFMNVTAPIMAMIDRSNGLSGLQNKVGAPIAVCSRQGGWNVITTLSLWFIYKHMFCADSILGLAVARGNIRNDERAMKASYELGKEVVALVNQKLRWPEGYDHSVYSDVVKKYNLKYTPFG
jgi:multimeric flavodoxin WrbA